MKQPYLAIVHHVHRQSDRHQHEVHADEESGAGHADVELLRLRRLLEGMGLHFDRFVLARDQSEKCLRCRRTSV